MAIQIINSDAKILGIPRNTSFENWTTPGNPGSGVCEFWTVYSVNGGLCFRQTDAPSGGGTYSANIRSNSSGNISSIGGIVSEIFYLSSNFISWYQKSENANVAFTVRLLTEADVEIASYSPPISIGTWLKQSWDVSAYKNQILKLRFEQHTTQEAYGWYTLVDLVDFKGIVTKTINSNAVIKRIITKTIISDAEVTPHWRQYINSDSKIKVLNNQKIVLSDAKSVYYTIVKSDTLESLAGLWSHDPRICRDQFGYLHAIYTVNSTSLMYTKSTDNGATWSTPEEVVYQAGEGVYRPRAAGLIVDEIGYVHVIYKRAGTIFTKRRTGAGWQSEILITGIAGGYFAEGDPTIRYDDAHGVIHIFVGGASDTARQWVYSNDYGATYINSPDVNIVNEWIISATIGTNGDVHMIYMNYVYGGGGDMWYRKAIFNDYGDYNVLDQVKIYDGDNAGFHSPHIFRDSANDLWVAFRQYSNARFYYIRCQSGVWGGINEIALSTWNSTYSICRGCCDAQRNVYFVYADGSDITTKVYYKKFDFETGILGSAIQIGLDEVLGEFSCEHLIPSTATRLYFTYRTTTPSPDALRIHYIPVETIPVQKTINSNAKIKVLNNQQNILSDGKVVTREQEDILSDAHIKAIEQQDILSGANIKVLGTQQNILSDAKVSAKSQQTILSDSSIKGTYHQDILSDSKIKVLNNQQTILSDAKIMQRFQQNILSDSFIKVTGILKTINSNAKVVIQVLKDINNKFNSCKQILKNIDNKFNMVIRVINDIDNYINFCKAKIYDAINDFRMKKSILKNINNDVRFIKSWMVPPPGAVGFQSLGKDYIHVYINSIDQTDVDVDSINISKGLSNSHTASFELAKTYDSTPPTSEASVEIKYNNWTLFKGYVVTTRPSANPEFITIECSDEFWKQNKNNVYFHVGHIPTDYKEKYYTKINEALSTEFGWGLGIGNFVPDAIDCFAVGKSDAITNLIQDCGNYEWFYDVNGNKILWQAGAGSIITIERQTLGQNIGLYQLLDHNFSKSVDNIINKYRVQMGDKIIRALNDKGGTRTYAGYNYRYYEGFLEPAWDRNYEVLAKNSSSGYGWDYHKPSDSNKYKDIFTKFKIPYLDKKLASLTDRFQPYVRYYTGIYGSAYEGKITEGISIDYENRTVTFSQPMCKYIYDRYGNITGVKFSLMKLFLGKKQFYTNTQTPSEDPETDISNPLMFFTNKIGSYPDTILKDLNLSNLSIQVGGITYDADGNPEVIPSWDDTEYARDYAYWQLSKLCDEKIRGSIELTLDAVCFYGIDLSKRIYIAGITENPMNIIDMNYNISNFTVNLTLENIRGYTRTISLPTRGE